MDNRGYYVTGRPLKTRIGDLHFLLVKEQMPFIAEFAGVIMFEKNDLVKHLMAAAYENPDLKPLLDDVSSKTLFELLKADVKTTTMLGIQKVQFLFRAMFSYCFKEDVFDKIENSEEFDKYFKLIKDINFLNFEKPNPNEDIERFNQLRKKLDESKDGAITFESMYTSVWIELGHKPDDLTIYQLHALFNRINQFKSYDTTTQFATVSGDVKIETWFKDVDILKKEEKGLVSLDRLRNEQSSL